MTDIESQTRTFRLKRLVIMALASVFGGGLGAALWISTSLLPPMGGQTAPELSDRVEIVLDAYGVPHIFADTLTDAYFALGYVQARDRIWQMEASRRLAAGRLSEIFGKSTLKVDRLMRTLGIYRQAEESESHLSADVRQALEAYAQGVNFWLRNRRVSLSPELTALFHKPEPWRVADSLAWGKLMALRLAKNMDTELLRTEMGAHLSEDQLRDLWPLRENYFPTTLHSGRPGKTGAIDGRDFHLETSTQFSKARRLAEIRRDVFGAVGEASNAWVLAGKWTVSRLPILANDPHLDQSAPGLWYLARIHTPDLTLSGATAPGLPLFLFGQNGSIAWGITDAALDGEDLFIERISKGSPKNYDTVDGPQPFEIREEIIRVRGGDDVRLEVRGTRHGVIISDHTGVPKAFKDKDDLVLALSSTALISPDRSGEAFYRVNHARNWNEFSQGIKTLDAPLLNILYADREGNIGYRLGGRVPIRKAGLGEIPRPGWSGTYDWAGFIPENEKPSVYNPESGFLISANNKIIDDGYPHFLTTDWPSPYRAQRIGQLLGLTKLHSPTVTALIQNDILSLMVADLKPLMTGIEPGDPKLKAIVGVLREWDGRMLARRSEPLIFMAWLNHLREAVLRDELGPLLDGYGNFQAFTIRNILTNRPIWCDDVRTKDQTESCEQQLESALSSAISTLTERHGGNPLRWRWGHANTVVFTHGLARGNRFLSWLLSPSIEAGGGANTINKTRIGHSRAHGPGYRAIYDLSDPDRSRFMIAPGQSGNPLSTHYDSLVEDWRNGLYLSLGQSHSALQAQAAQTLTLEPGH